MSPLPGMRRVHARGVVVCHLQSCLLKTNLPEASMRLGGGAKPWQTWHLGPPTSRAASPSRRASATMLGGTCSWHFTRSLWVSYS